LNSPGYGIFYRFLRSGLVTSRRKELSKNGQLVSGLYPPSVLDLFHQIRVDGNAATHRRDGDHAKAVQRLAALEAPKSLRRPHAVIAACVVDRAVGLSALSGFILKQKLMGFPKKNGDILRRRLDFSFFFSGATICLMSKKQ